MKLSHELLPKVHSNLAYRPVICSSCLFGGTCIDMVNGFKCLCRPGFSGSNCQHAQDPCGEQSDYCLNGGTCIAMTEAPKTFDVLSPYGTKYFPVCHCSEGFMGKRCESFIDWCKQAPCWNGATCQSVANQFKCSCRPGFTGALCDVRLVSCDAAAVIKSN